MVGPIKGDDRACLGQAVTLEHRDLGGSEYPDEFGAERRAPDHHELEPPAHRLAPPIEDEFGGGAALGAVKDLFTLFGIEAACERYCPVEDRLFDPAEFGPRLEDALEDAL